MIQKLQTIIREIIIDIVYEASTTGNIAGYNTPYAFVKKNNFKKAVLQKLDKNYTIIGESNMKYITKEELLSMIREEIKNILTITEKWKKVKMYPKRRGMFKGKTIADLEAEKKSLKGKQPFTKSDKVKMAQLNFAIRAKRGWK